MSTRSLGVAVFGAGIAGKVRVRDIGCDGAKYGSRLIGYVSRRQVDIEGAQQLTEDEAFGHPDVDAVVVCTEPAAHDQIIRKALNRGKHVLVEFPVCTSATVTGELYSLAKEKGLMLHEENIALLSPAFLSMKERLRSIQLPIVKGEISFRGNYNGWVEDFQKSGGPFCVNVSLLQSLYDLVGDDLEATGGQLEVTDSGFTAVAKLSCSKCRDMTLIIKRTKEKSQRAKNMRFTLEDSSVIDDAPITTPSKDQSSNTQIKKPGLFMQDFIRFVEKVQGTRDNTLDAARTIHCIRVADDIHKYMGLGV